MAELAADKPVAIKRFYKDVAVKEEAAHSVLLLDGRPAKTKARNPLASDNKDLMAQIADEWAAQAEHIDFTTMPLTRLHMTAIDLGTQDSDAWIETILSFLKSDLVCYRAENPSVLRERQAGAWDPLLALIHDRYGVTLRQADGIVFVEQSTEAIAQAETHLRSAEAPVLLALKTITEIAGSAVIAFALWSGSNTAQDLFFASRVDEEFQIEKWGQDAEAEARARLQQKDFEAAAVYLAFWIS